MITTPTKELEKIYELVKESSRIYFSENVNCYTTLAIAKENDGTYYITSFTGSSQIFDLKYSTDRYKFYSKRIQLKKDFTIMKLFPLYNDCIKQLKKIKLKDKISNLNKDFM